MADKKKEQTNDTWAKMENPMSILGKFAWLIALGAAIYALVQGIIALNTYNYYMQLASAYPSLLGYYQTLAATFTFSMIWGFACVGVCIVIIFIYVLKPFGTKCAAKDWESLIEDKLGGGFPKMWLFAILLAVFSWGWGCVGVLVPVVMLTFIGPGKGRVFGKK